jgi:dTDP-4-amino-4,6-dideoxygalactose transaminase
MPMREIEAVVEVLRSSTLDLGPCVADFEARVARILAKRHGVMVNSGSSALRLAIDLSAAFPRASSGRATSRASRVMERALMLPTHQGLSSEDLDYVVEQLEALPGIR